MADSETHNEKMGSEKCALGEKFAQAKFFDYFSKNAHWNPLTIKELTTKSDDETVTYKPFTLTLFTLTIALKAICGFTLFYTLNFVPEQQDIVDKLTKIRDEFNDSIGHAFQINSIDTLNFRA